MALAGGRPDDGHVVHTEIGIGDKDTWSFGPWDSRVDRSRFDCGEHALNQWLREQAGQAERRDTARTFLARAPNGDLAGYLSLSVAQVEAERLGTPRLSQRYPIAAVRLARLAVDLRYQGQGLGAGLLAQAVRLAHEVMERAAIQVLLVDALSLDVVAFYARWGFRPLLDDPSKLFLTAAQIRASIPGPSRSD